MPLRRRMGNNLWPIGRLVLAVCLMLGLAAGPQPRAGETVQVRLPRPASLAPRIRFWRDVFARYSVRDFVVHDRDKPWRVYGVFHMPGEGEPSPAQVAEIDRSLKRDYGAILKRLATGAKPASAGGRRVAAEFAGEPLKAYAQAADNIRIQQGLRERFHRGLLRSRHYVPMMKRVFRRFGVPTDLVTLAAVESQFHPGARSPAGALGIWQFMRTTARRFMRVSRHRDDRLSPYRSTVAAAKLLLYNYRTLGSWPLAITAYNYGAGGTARAAEQCGTSIARIIREYDGPGFGFAVQNYYAEFLATLELYREASRYFAGYRHAPAEDDGGAPPAPGRYRVRRGDTIYGIAHAYHASASSLMRANHIRRARSLRIGTVLRVPGAGHRARPRYRVRRGDTLYAIGRRYGVSVDSLKEANSVDNARGLQIGTVITIPGV
jgi:peptidoglycan lytic transglycosylase D